MSFLLFVALFFFGQSEENDFEMFDLLLAGDNDTESASPSASSTIRTPTGTVIPASANPTLTLRLEVTPFSVEGDEPINVSKETPIQFSGTGTIFNESGGVLELDDVTIDTGAQITAQNLTIGVKLVLLGSGVLQAAQGDHITVSSGINITIQVYGDGVPRVDLGEIGSDYDVVPGSIQINPDVLASYHPDDLEEQKWRLISGKRITNCEKWKEKVTILGPDLFEAQCQNVSDGLGLRLLGDTAENALFLVGKGSNDSPPEVWATSAPSSGLSGGAIAGIVIACVVVVIAIVIIAVLVRRRRPGGDLERVSSGHGSVGTDSSS